MKKTMAYNPNLHNRRSIRMKGYDYSQAGLYFITICCQNRECRFGKIENDEMILNEYGIIAYNEWAKLPGRFTNFELDVFQIMPNHMHGIIMLNDVVGAGFTPAQNDGGQLKNGNGQPQGNGQPLWLPQRLATLWVHTNHWWQTGVWKFIKRKTIQWGNYGNAITTNTLLETNNRIKPFPITS